MFVDVLSLRQVGFDEIGECSEPARARLVLLKLDKLKLIESHGLNIDGLFGVVHSRQGLDVRVHVTVVSCVTYFLAALVTVKS